MIKKRLQIPKGLSESVIRGMTDNNNNNEKGQKDKKRFSKHHA
jgi:hypothetical protein